MLATIRYPGAEHSLLAVYNMTSPVHLTLAAALVPTIFPKRFQYGQL